MRTHWWAQRIDPRNCDAPPIFDRPGEREEEEDAEFMETWWELHSMGTIRRNWYLRTDLDLKEAYRSASAKGTARRHRAWYQKIMAQAHDGDATHANQRRAQGSILTLLFAFLTLAALLHLSAQKNAAAEEAATKALPPGTITMRKYFNQFPPEMHPEIERELGMR